MRKAMLTLAGILLLALLAAPAIAVPWYDVIHDSFYLGRGYGLATVRLSDGSLATFRYDDNDHSRSYTPGDDRTAAAIVPPGGERAVGGTSARASRGSSPRIDRSRGSRILGLPWRPLLHSRTVSVSP